MKLLPWAVPVLVCVLTGCAATASPSGVVDRYLSEMSNKTGRHSEYVCLNGGKIDKFQENVLRWSVQDIIQTTDEKDLDSTYYIAKVKVEHESGNGFTVQKTWEIDVWNSDELFESQKRMAARVIEAIEGSQETLAIAKEMLGETVEAETSEDKEEYWIPERENISQKEYCVTDIKMGT